MTNIIKKVLDGFLGILLLITAMNFPVHAIQDEKKEDSQNTKKMRGKRAWEYLVNAPGIVLSLPFWLLEAGITPVFDLVLEKKIIAKTVDFLTSDDGRRGVFPVYASRTGGGLKFFQKDLIVPGSKLDIIGTIGLRNRQLYQIHFKRLKLSGPFTSAFSVLYKNLSDEPFFGIGNDSNMDNKSNFAHKQVSAQATLGADLAPRTYFTTTIGWDQNDILEGHNKTLPSTTDSPLEEQVKIPGLFGEVSVFRIQTLLEHDSKNRIGNPSGGWEAKFKAGLFSEIKNSNFGFWQAALDITKYFNLFYNRTLVLRLATQFTEPLENRSIPFYYMSELGEEETIRGFSRGRFRDQDKILGSAEYRYPLLSRSSLTGIDATIFVDTGRVYRNIFEEFNTENFHLGYGGGLRFYSPEGVYLQILLGKSTDGFRFYLVLN